MHFHLWDQKLPKLLVWAAFMSARSKNSVIHACMLTHSRTALFYNGSKIQKASCFFFFFCFLSQWNRAWLDIPSVVSGLSKKFLSGKPLTHVVSRTSCQYHDWRCRRKKNTLTHSRVTNAKLVPSSYKTTKHKTKNHKKIKLLLHTNRVARTFCQWDPLVFSTQKWRRNTKNRKIVSSEFRVISNWHDEIEWNSNDTETMTKSKAHLNDSLIWQTNSSLRQIGIRTCDLGRKIEFFSRFSKSTHAEQTR